MGMRATVSRDMALEDVVVPDDAEVLPPGLFGAMYNAFPHLLLSFSATFLRLMQAAWDGALACLTGRMPGAPIPPRVSRLTKVVWRISRAKTPAGLYAPDNFQNDSH